MEQAAYDWSRFCKRISIKASLKQIYDAWTIPSQLETWFLRKAEFMDDNRELIGSNNAIEKGNTYKWLWHGYDDSVFEIGTVLEANGIDRFQFIFGKAGRVNVNIFAENDEMIVELWQEQIPTDEKNKSRYHVGCIEGWTFYLANLKSVLEGGLDLRNTNSNICEVVNA